MSFLDELHKGTNRGVTANGAISNKSTLDPLLDFFSNAGSMRERPSDALRLFKKAFSADRQGAVRCLFYLRDVRGGQGERDIPRTIFASLDEETALKVIQFVPEYGRWDDLFSFPDTEKVNAEIASFIKNQLEMDEAQMSAGGSVSLMAKWLPSENTSSSKTHKQALKLMKLLGLKPSQYRRKLVALRKHIQLVEHLMSSRQWGEVDYSKLPSQAHRKHIKAFKRHDETRYAEFIGAVVKGEKTINTGTLFTYEVFDAVQEGHDAEANAMWKNLPDYTNGQNALVLADVSGSMSGRPMSISVSLALYFAERNEGPFKDYFLTFTSHSKLQKITGNTLTERLESIENSDWEMSTNIQSAFDAILSAAVNSKASQDEMPKVLYIISDMQFDQATDGNNETNLQTAERKFEAAGYELPHVVFWNCHSIGNDAPATKYDSKVTLISGQSQSTFQYVLAGKTPVESMNDILNSERYAQIIV